MLGVPSIALSQAYKDRNNVLWDASRTLGAGVTRELLAIGWSKRGLELGCGIGIALGYATLGTIGFERRLEYSAIGSVMNLASRLCDEAKAGQIVMSRRVFSEVERMVEAAELGALQLKGFSRPVPAYELIAVR